MFFELFAAKSRDAPYYAFALTGYLYGWRRRTQKLGTDRAIGDEITLTLNAEDKSLEMVPNGNVKEKNVHQNIECENIKYTLAIALSRIDQKVKIINFETERK